MKDLGCLNKTLLSKWCCCFATERGMLWNLVIRAKYGGRRGVGALVRWVSLVQVCGKQYTASGPLCLLDLILL